MFWIAPLIIIALAILFSFSTSMNSKIERPEDCEDVESCESCGGAGCTFNATSEKISKG
jgi:hypothetical protein